jgi:fimbrial chaperone protein
MPSPAVVSKALLVAATLACAGLSPERAVAGSLRVGPTRLDLSVRHPVVVLEVQNTGGSAALAQLDTFAWRQAGGGDLLEPTADIIVTPTVMELAPGETRLVRVGLRQANAAEVERSYRLFVREVPTEGGPALRFALRIGVPVFALAAQAGVVPADLGWRWMPPDVGGCTGVQVINSSGRHERILAGEIVSAAGEVLWRSSEPVYVLARSRRRVPPALCAPSMKEAASLRLTLESRTLVLPAEAPSLILDAYAH